MRNAMAITNQQKRRRNPRPSPPTRLSMGKPTIRPMPTKYNKHTCSKIPLYTKSSTITTTPPK